MTQMPLVIRKVQVLLPFGEIEPLGVVVAAGKLNAYCDELEAFTPKIKPAFLLGESCSQAKPIRRRTPKFKTMKRRY